MRKIILSLSVLLCLNFLSAQQSSLTVFGPGTAFCSSDVTYNVTISNVDVSNDPLPLVNTSVSLEIWKENQDPTLDLPFKTILTEGPNIAVNDFHVFKVVIPQGSFDGDGTYSLIFTFFADADKNEKPVSPEFDLKMSFCGIGFVEARDTLKGYITENISLSDDQVSYINMEKVSKGTIIKSWNHVELEIEITSESYVGFVASDPYSEFGQSAKLITVGTFPVIISTYDLNFWPVIGGEDWNPIPDESELFGFEFPEEGDEPVEFEEIGQIDNPKTCAIIVSGKDGNQIKEELYIKQAELYKRNLMNNPLGPRLPEEQIIIAHKAGRDSLLNLISQLNSNYDKVIFYYTGHGSKNGKMCVGNNSNEWISYSDFINAMYSTEANDFCFFIGCCYSGQIIEEIKNDARSCEKNIEVLTSANSEKPSIFSIWRDPMGEIYKGYSVFNHHFNICSSEAQADVTNDGFVDFQESYDWMQLVNPPSPGGLLMFDNQCPQIYTSESADCGMTMEEARNIIKVSSEDPENTLGSDQSVAVHPEILPEGTKIESFNTEEMSITTDKPFYLGWSMTNLLSDFEQPCKLFLLDPETGEVMVEDLNWWTKINGENWFPPLNGPEFIDPPTYAEDIPSYSILENIEKIEDPKTCALLISGIDGSETRMDIFKNDVNEFKNSLQNSPFGPKLPDSQVVVRSGISKDSIKQLLKELRYGYDIIYFYYRGNGTKDGKMATGSGPDEFYSYDEFSNDLLLSGAELINLLADCSYSGNIINSIKSNSKSCFKDIYVSTSTSDQLTSRTILGTMDGKIEGYGIHTFTFNLFNRDVEIDINNDGFNALNETATIMDEEQPFDPFGDNPWEYQQPQKGEKEYDELANNLVYLDFLRGINPSVFEDANVYADVKELGQVAIQYYEDLVFEKPEDFGILVFEPNISEFFPKDYGLGLISYSDDCSEQTLEYYPFENGEFPLNLSAEDLVTTSLSEEKQIRQGKFEISPVGLPLLSDGGEIPTSNERGALLIADYVTPAWEPQIRRGLESIGRKITNEEFGPKVQEDNINVFTTINEKRLCEEIEGQKDRYRHLYFYLQMDAFFDGVIFRGELTKINAAPDLSPGISYHEIFCKLVETNIDTLTIILETGSDIETILEAIESSKLKDVDQVNIFTSSYNGIQGRLIYNSDGDYLLGSNATNIFSEVGNSQADLNEDGEIHMVEAFIGYNKGNPGNPLAFSTWWESKSANDNTDFSDFTNVNLNFEEDQSNPQKFSVQTKISENPTFPESLQELFEEVSKKTSSINPLDVFLFRDSQKGQIQFKVDSVLDYMQSQEGILGLLHRKDESSDWTIINNVTYDEVSNVLTTDTMNICGDFIIARLKEMSSSVSNIHFSEIELKAFPTLFNEELRLQFHLNDSKEIRFNLVSLDGKVVRQVTNHIYGSGLQEIKFDTENLPIGNYVVQLIEKNNKSKLLMVTKI